MKMKKILSLLLAAATAMSMSVSVFAADEAAKIGEKTYETLAAAVEVAQPGDTVELLKDVDTDASIKINKSITIDGAGHTVSTSKDARVFMITGANTEAGKITVTLSDMKMFGTGAATVDTRGGYLKLVLDSTEIGGSGDNNQPVRISYEPGAAVRAEVEIKNSTIEASESGYAVTAHTAVDMTISDCNLSGYSALRTCSNSQNSKILVQNSTLEGKNKHTEASDSSYGTVIMQADGVTIDFENSTIKATKTANDALQSAILYSSYATANNSTVNIKSGSRIEANGEYACVMTNYNPDTVNYKLICEAGVTSNADISEYCADDTAVVQVNGEYKVVAADSVKVSTDAAVVEKAADGSVATGFVTRVSADEGVIAVNKISWDITGNGITKTTGDIQINPIDLGGAASFAVIADGLDDESAKAKATVNGKIAEKE